MSLGVWTLRQMIQKFNHIANSGFDFVIDEVHHNQKIDNPSGTAITLKNDLEKAINHKIPEIEGKRIGGIFGQHIVTAASKSEVLKIEHFALNRSVFAEGAVQAALWIINKKSGFYSMDDMMLNKIQKSL